MGLRRGRDWRTALGVVLALGLTALVAETSVAAWWIMPLVVLALLAHSIRRAAKGATRSGSSLSKEGEEGGGEGSGGLLIDMSTLPLSYAAADFGGRRHRREQGSRHSHRSIHRSRQRHHRLSRGYDWRGWWCADDADADPAVRGDAVRGHLERPGGGRCDAPYWCGVHFRRCTSTFSWLAGWCSARCRWRSLGPICCT